MYVSIFKCVSMFVDINRCFGLADRRIGDQGVAFVLTFGFLLP